LDINPYLPEIDARANVRVGWVNETDFSRVYAKGLKESKHVQ
jgi:hypothetical protein